MQINNFESNEIIVNEDMLYKGGWDVMCWFSVFVQALILLTRTLGI